MKNEVMRVFIIANSKFPRGSAVANYIQYLILAITNAGYKVILVSDLNAEYGYVKDIASKFANLDIEPFKISSNRIFKHFQYKMGFAYEIIHILKCKNLSGNDLVLSFGTNSFFLNKLLRLKAQIGFKTIKPLLEIFDKDNVENEKKDYANYKRTLDEIVTKSDIILPISSYIEDYYKKKGCRTFLLPIMADCQEFPIVNKEKNKYKFILPANGKMKDDLTSMLKGFALLPKEEACSIELHICGVNEKKICEILSTDEYKKLSPILTVHKWMKYDELVELYQQMHFLILARQTCQMTLANFPSKVPETMAFGIVPVCSDVGDYTRYYLKDGVDSIFINGSSPEECCKSIRKALSLSWEEYVRYSENARNTAETRFDYRVWTSKIREMLESL